MNDLAHKQLVQMAQRSLAHARAGTIDQTDGVGRVPAANYLDPDRFEREVDRIFRRTPLVLALSAELPAPGCYKALEAAGRPVLIVRGPDGTVRSFFNTCSHRGAQVVAEGTGKARRFSCPYHAWTYDAQGALVGILAPDDFGEVDRACHGLTALPTHERAGLVWVGLRPDLDLDFGGFLAGYDALLERFGFETWHVFGQREVAGPNWKIAYDGYLDLYHLPILHKDTFGPDFPNRPLYTAWGPHQRMDGPNPSHAKLEGTPEADWPEARLLTGVWTIFPHVSIATFETGGRAVLVSQLFPGETVGTSITRQTYLMERAPADDERAGAEQMFELLGHVVREEDYATGLRQQRALATGALDEVLFGRNEGGGQRFHAWVERLLEADDEDLDAAFAAGDPLG